MCLLMDAVEVRVSLLLLPLLPSLLSLAHVHVPLLLIRYPIIIVTQAACLMPPFGIHLFK
jgi:hypothetical protein